MNHTLPLAGQRGSTFDASAELDVARVSAVAFLGLAAYLFLAIMRFQEYTWIDISVPIIPIIEVVMIAGWLFSRKPPGFTDHLPVLLLGGVFFISSLSAGAEYSVQVTINYVLNIAFVYVVLAQVAVDARRADLIMAVFCSCMAVISVQCILMSQHPDHIGWTGLQAFQRLDTADRIWQVRYVGTLGDPNDLGMTLVAAVPMLAYLARSSNSSLLKLYFLVALGLCVYTIFLLESRGTLLGLMAIAGIWVMFRFGIGRSVFLLLVAIPLLIVFAPGRLGESGMDRSALDRIDSWYNGMKMFASHPFFGVGKDQYLAHHYKVSHNSWIEIVAEFGMIGYLLWNRIVLGALFDAFQMVRADQTLRSAAAHQEEPEQRPASGGRRVARTARPLLAFAEASAIIDAQASHEMDRTRALFFSMFGVLVAIFFIDRSDSLITFLVCALIAGSHTRYRLTRPDIRWLPVSFWVYLGAFVALVVVYVAVQVFVLV